MPEVIVTLKDANGTDKTFRAWDDGSGNLILLQEITVGGVQLGTSNTLPGTPYDSSGTELFTDGNPGRAQLTGSNGVLAGTKTIAAPGTPEAIVAASTPIRGVLVRAKLDNAGTVYVGPSGSEVFELGPGDDVGLPLTDLIALYLDADVAADGVTWVAAGVN